MRHLLKVKETYRVDTVAEVDQLHSELKNSTDFTLTAFSYKTKFEKEKGEVVGEYQIVDATKVFNDEKDPVSDVTISYEVN